MIQNLKNAVKNYTDLIVSYKTSQGIDIRGTDFDKKEADSRIELLNQTDALTVFMDYKVVPLLKSMDKILEDQEKQKRSLSSWKKYILKILNVSV